jgi:hypothetical protein
MTATARTSLATRRPSTSLAAAALAALACVGGAASCSRNASPPASEEIPAAAAAATERNGAAERSAAQAPPGGEGAPVAPGPSADASRREFGAAGVRWRSPARWTPETGRPMRVVSYAIPAAAGDPEGGELGVFFFGSGQGGDVDSNLERWYGQFVQPDGRPVGAAERREKRIISGLPVTVVEISGTYLLSPFPMSPEKTPKPGYRMLGAIVEAPQGNVFFKLTAPEATARAAAPEFDALLGSLTRG